MAERVGICRNTNDQHSWTATQAYVPGELVEILGKIGIVEGEVNVAVGDEVNVAFDKQVDLLKADPANVFAVDAIIQWDTTAKRAPNAAATFAAGRCSKASAAGDLYVRVHLNFA